MPRPPLEDFLLKGRVYNCGSISKEVRRVSYDEEDEHLFVSYKGGGSYVYLNITELEARSFWFAASKNGWIWTYIRVRGSRTQHQKPYYQLE